MQPLSSAQEIDGWMNHTELAWLRSAALSLRPGSTVVELGSWKGRSTVALAVDHVNLICVDLFQGFTGDSARETEAEEDIYQVFCTNMRRLHLHPTVLRLDALQAYSLFRDASVDLVFDDCDHGPRFMQHFWSWLPKITPGGIYCGHDYDRRNFPDIPRVLHSSGITFNVVRGTTIWAFRKL